MHTHRHQPQTTGRILRWSLAVTVLFVAVEALAGFRAGSLALLSDAGHNFTDALALLLAVFGNYFQTKPADEVKTYGYHRAGVLAAFVNALSLIGLAGFIFWEASHRLREPQKVDETIMLAVAVAGLAVNVGVMLGLRADKDHDLNIRAAFVHMLGDALGSVGIIAGAILIGRTGWLWIDPLLSVLIGFLIVWTAWDIIKESLNILLEGLPRGMDLRSVVGLISSVPGVRHVHDLHIWSLGSSVHALSCHVVIEDVPLSESNDILNRINALLCERHQIHHTTVQFEHQGCLLSETSCTIHALPPDRRRIH